MSFANWKDKENVLRQAKLLKGCGIYITGLLLIPLRFIIRITEDVTNKAGAGAKGKLRRSSSVNAVAGLDKVS